jgi:hypothetical protein
MVVRKASLRNILTESVTILLKSISGDFWGFEFKSASLSEHNKALWSLKSCGENLMNNYRMLLKRKVLP